MVNLELDKKQRAFFIERAVNHVVVIVFVVSSCIVQINH